MASLKSLRIRIKSVKSTQKITSAMKMVAAAKLRKAQEKAEQARPYAHGLQSILINALDQQPDMPVAPLLLTGRHDNPTHLVVAVTSDRGLCGGFNVNIIRDTKALIKTLQAQNVPVKIYCVGRRSYDLLKRDYGDLIIHTERDLTKAGVTIEQVNKLSQHLQKLIEDNVCGRITLIYSFFKSALTQVVTHHPIVPLILKGDKSNDSYEFEPDQQTVINELLPKNFSIQLYQILLESNASEQGARMTAMDNATNNARDVIKRLELNYNQTRQAVITRELIEIISGAEAL